ncbi:MAG: GTPase [archaeon]
MFSKMPQVPRKDELLNKAFSHARTVKKTIDPHDRINSIREYEQNKINTSSTVINTTLHNILAKTPQTSELDEFYQNLVALVIDINQFKKSLAALKWAIGFNKELEHKYRRRIKGAPLKSIAPIRKEYYGRLSSVVKQIQDDLIFLEECRKVLKKLPILKNLPTVVIAGYPNVGKSSLLKSLTGAEPEIKNYPFTTKKILVGSIDEKVQMIDTPGLLDRLPDERNQIERHAMLALRYKAGLILFLIDATESCGYPLAKQALLCEHISREFKNIPIIICMTKSELLKEKDSKKNALGNTIYISSKTGENIELLRKLLLRSVDWKTYQFRIKDKSDFGQ